MQRGFGLGMGCRARGGAGVGMGRGFGANADVNCRMYPWLPRRWRQTSVNPGDVQGQFAGAPSENEYLQSQAQFLKDQLNEVEKRLQKLQDNKND